MNLKDIILRVLYLSPKESRSISDILLATKESLNNAPYKKYYTGSIKYSLDADGNITWIPNEDRDSHKLYLYQDNSKGAYQEIPESLKRGYDYSKFTKDTYGITPKEYYGNMALADEVELPILSKPLIQFLMNNNIRYNINPENEVYFDSEDLDGKIIDDTASYRALFGKDKQGNDELQLDDLIDFGGSYEKKYGKLAGVLGNLLSLIGTPFVLKLFLPIKYVDEKNITNGDAIKLVKQIANKNNIMLYNKTSKNYEHIGSLPEVVVTPSGNYIED